MKATGARVLSSATTVAEAVWLDSRGCDAIIAQGAEAGGHRGMFLTGDVATQIGTLSLVPQIAQGLDALLARDGFATVADAVGTGRADWL